MRLIKRYPNRKLYDTSARAYVTLQEIAQMVSGGEAVQVVDTRSGHDVTKVALSKIVLEREKTGGVLTPAFLTDLVKRSSGSIMGYLKRTVHIGQNAATWVEDEVNKQLKGLVRLGKLAVKDAEGLRHDLAGKIREQLANEEVALDQRIKGVLEKGLRAVNLPTKSEVERLNGRLDALESRIDKLLGNGRRHASARKAKAGRVSVRDATRRAA